MEEGGLRLTGENKLFALDAPSMMNGEIEIIFDQKNDYGKTGFLFRGNPEQNEWQGMVQGDDDGTMNWSFRNSGGRQYVVCGDGTFLLSREGLADTKLKVRFQGETISVWLDDYYVYSGTVSDAEEIEGMAGISTESQSDILVKQVVFRTLPMRTAEEDGSTENNDDKDYFRQITAETTVGVMRHGIAVVILMPESVGSGDDIDNATLSYTSPNVNVVTNFGTSVQNTSIWHATMGSGRGQADIAVQNLEQNNSPASSVHAAGLGIYPYFITEKYVKEGASLDLIATKQGLVRQLMLQSFQNNNTASADRTSHLYMNDLTGFCVVNDDDSRGWMTANRETCYSWLLGTQWRWGQDDDSNLYDYRDVQNFDYVADWIRGEHEGQGQTADFSPTRPEADEPYEGQTSIRITGDHSFMGNGGNNALLASQMNPYAEDQIRRFVNDGRTPLGIVFMSFVGTDEVRFGNHTYNVQGNTLPALIVANNFKFALATQASMQGGN